jgi:two-component system, cell cycle sensor histidine kinase and response regulator CckA
MESPRPDNNPVGNLTPFRIAIGYVVIGGCWFLVTDEVINRLVSIPVHLLFARTAIFIVVTAVPLYYLVNRLATDLFRSNADLRESTARANTYLESAVEGIVSVDDQGNILSANPAAQQLFGYSRGELVGQPIEILIPERLNSRHRSHRAQYFEAPRSRRMGRGLDLFGKRRNGSEFPVEVSLSFARTDKGRLAVAFVTDITERRALEREARRGQTLAALGLVAAGIVHEINTPIGIISSRAEFLLTEGSGLASDFREGLDVIHRNALRVGRITQGLLNLARHEHKAWSSLNINDVIESVLLLVAKQMSKDGIRIETALDPAIPRVNGDLTALEDVMINLLVNARDAMPGGGTIKIKTEIAGNPPGGVRIIVADQGAGVQSEQIPRLFDPFFSTKDKGLGVGLWLTRRIVAEHQGTIDVKSEPGKGTQFLVVLPANSDSGR